MAALSFILPIRIHLFKSKSTQINHVHYILRYVYVASHRGQLKHLIIGILNSGKYLFNRTREGERKREKKLIQILAHKSNAGIRYFFVL